MRSRSRKHPLVLAAAVCYLIVACATQDQRSGARYRWWAGLGPVLPHDSFPADCKLCHIGQKWNTLTESFRFDHEKETGVALEGAHSRARCLLCHNDRGPVAEFKARGCTGCHEDYHYGELGKDCTACHDQNTWYPSGQIELHNRTRFPLTGAHVAVACHRCHPGAFTGNFVPADTECVTCHRVDLANTTNPPHLNLGFVDRCDRCHMPTNWRQVRTN